LGAHLGDRVRRRARLSAAQQLAAAGETVVDVPATLASTVRVLKTERSNKNDPYDALSVAVAALRFRELRRVAPVAHGEVLRVLAKRNTDIGSQRTRVVCRMHSLLAELVPGGIAKEINAFDVDRLFETVNPAKPVERVGYDLAVELLDDIRRLDEQLKVSHKRIRDAVRASATSLTDLFGVGPIIAGMLIGYSGDISRFANPRSLTRTRRDGGRRQSQFSNPEGKPAPCWPAGLKAEVDVNRQDPGIDRHCELADLAQGLENEPVVAEDIGVRGRCTVRPSVVEQGCSQAGSDSSALPGVLDEHSEIERSRGIDSEIGNAYAC
jgi:transposase